MRTSLLGAVSALAVGVTGAHAADMFDPPLDWNGPYIGGNVGAAILDGDLDYVDLFGVGAGSDNLHDTGLTLGGQAGWNFQLDQFVFGIEGDLNYLDVGDPDTFTVAKGPIVARTDYDWFATIRGRAGMAMGSTLFYVTGGVAFIDSDLRITDQFGLSASDSDVLFGWTIGGGAEYAFDRRWSGKLEYLYASFESHSVATANASAEADPELHVIRLGLNYHFCTGGAC